MNTVITIGRQFGSAGREIGEKVAEYFGIKCYDKELLTRAAKESGFCEEMIQNHDERPTNSFLYNLVMDTNSFRCMNFMTTKRNRINIHILNIYIYIP